MYLSSKSKQDSLVSWVICLSAAGFFFFDFVQISMMNTLHEELVAALGIDVGKAGYYVNIPFSLGNWLWIFPAAFLIDRFSIRKVTITMLSLSIFGALGTALSHKAYLTAFFRFISGSAHSFCFLSCTTLVYRWFSPIRRATVMSIAVAVGISGLLAAQLPLHYLNKWIGWRGSLFVNAMLGCVFLLVGFLFIRDYPVGKEPKIPLVRKKITGLIDVLKNRQIWFYSLCTAFLNAPIVGIVFTYLNHFLIRVHAVEDSTFASGMSSLLFLGHIIGSSFSGVLSNYWESRKIPLFGASILAFFTFSILVFCGPLSTWLIAFLLFFFGVILGFQVLSYSAISELSHPNLVATSMSIASFVIMGSIPIFQAITDGTLNYARGLKHLSVKTVYFLGFSPILMALFAGCIISLLLQETYLVGKSSKKMKSN